MEEVGFHEVQIHSTLLHGTAYQKTVLSTHILFLFAKSINKLLC
jgi:hypothetical protein